LDRRILVEVASTYLGVLLHSLPARPRPIRIPLAPGYVPRCSVRLTRWSWCHRRSTSLSTATPLGGPCATSCCPFLRWEAIKIPDSFSCELSESFDVPREGTGSCANSSTGSEVARCSGSPGPVQGAPGWRAATVPGT